MVCGCDAAGSVADSVAAHCVLGLDFNVLLSSTGVALAMAGVEFGSVMGGAEHGGRVGQGRCVSGAERDGRLERGGCVDGAEREGRVERVGGGEGGVGAGRASTRSRGLRRWRLMSPRDTLRNNNYHYYTLVIIIK